MDAADRAGAPVPGRRRIVTVFGKRALALERIVGPSMWQSLLDEPGRAHAIGGQLASVQVEIGSCTPGYELPTQHDRLVSKVHIAARDHGSHLLAVLDRLTPTVGPLMLCHGDLHPRNVILGPNGPVPVDWYDASRGTAASETARTSLILEVSHHLGLGGVSDVGGRALRDGYLEAAIAHFGLGEAELATWMLVHRVARLAEGLGAEHLDQLRDDLAAAPT